MYRLQRSLQTGTGPETRASRNFVSIKQYTQWRIKITNYSLPKKKSVMARHRAYGNHSRLKPAQLEKFVQHAAEMETHKI